MTEAEKVLFKHWNTWRKDVTLDADFVEQVILVAMEEYKNKKEEPETGIFDMSTNPVKFVHPYKRLIKEG